MPNIKPRFINAIGTPLDGDEGLHVDGLHRHLDDQWSNGIDGVLVAGTMGLLQLLRDETYRQLVVHSLECSQGRGELLVGAGDTSFVRTRDRIEYLNRFKLDGVVVLSPFFIRFNQHELVDYYTALANMSRHPLYMYHLPVLTGAELTLETVVQLAAHPNICGIKCSCDWGWTRQLMDQVTGDFRIIVAQATRVVELAKHGVVEHLDGIFSLVPRWTHAMGEACHQGQWDRAEQYQLRVKQLLEVVQRVGVFPAFTAIANAMGIAGNFAPAPYRPLDARMRQILLEQPIVRQLISGKDEADDTQTDSATAHRVA
jgi:4-hydroxy-tetrahydrodipicolinate synthase